MSRQDDEVLHSDNHYAGDANLGAVSPALPVRRRDAGLALTPAAKTVLFAVNRTHEIPSLFTNAVCGWCRSVARGHRGPYTGPGPSTSCDR